MMSRPARIAAWLLDATAVALALIFLTLAGRGVWMGAKAMLADRLIARAFAAHVRDGQDHVPWSWADIHPLATLEVPRLGVRRYVLSGASGSSLAFGIGHVDGTDAPNGPGHCVLAGHRDTRFSFLEDLRPGDELILTTRDGRLPWRVEGLGIVDETWVDLLEATASRHLTLVTCWPFRTLAASSQRYVIWCRPADLQGARRMDRFAAYQR